MEMNEITYNAKIQLPMISKKKGKVHIHCIHIYIYLAAEGLHVHLIHLHVARTSQTRCSREVSASPADG